MPSPRPGRGLAAALLSVPLLLAPAAAPAAIVDLSPITGAPDGRIDRALNLLQAGKAAEAEAVARRVLDSNPGSAAAHELMGAALAFQEKVPEAIAELHRALEANPKQYTAWVKLGDIAAAMSQDDKAVSFYRAALAIAPDDRLANQRIGVYLERHGDIPGAIEHLEKGIVGTPETYLGVRVDLAALLVRAGHPDRALAVLKHWDDAAARGEAVAPAALLVLGEARLATGDADSAIERFRAVLAGQPDDADALLGLGRAERQAGDLDAATETLTRAAALAPDEPAPQIALAATEAAAGDGDAAERRLDRLLAGDAGADAATLVQAARLYGAMARYAKARDAFARVLAIAPDDPEVEAAMAATLMRLGDMPGALDHARQRLDLTPGDPDATFQVGMLEEATGDRAGAAEAYGKAIEAAPDHWPSLNNLALLRLADGRADDALSLAQRAVSVVPENPVALDTLADVYEATGDPAHAAETRARLAEAYIDAGQTAEAQAALDAAAEAATDPALRARIAGLRDRL